MFIVYPYFHTNVSKNAMTEPKYVPKHRDLNWKHREAITIKRLSYDFRLVAFIESLRHDTFMEAHAVPFYYMNAILGEFNKYGHKKQTEMIGFLFGRNRFNPLDFILGRKVKAAMILF